MYICTYSYYHIKIFLVTAKIDKHIYGLTDALMTKSFSNKIVYNTCNTYIVYSVGDALRYCLTYLNSIGQILPVVFVGNATIIEWFCTRKGITEQLLDVKVGLRRKKTTLKNYMYKCQLCEI